MACRANSSGARPERLIGFIADHSRTTKIRSDHRLVITGETHSPTARLKRVRHVVQDLARLAA